MEAKSPTWLWRIPISSKLPKICNSPTTSCNSDPGKGGPEILDRDIGLLDLWHFPGFHIIFTYVTLYTFLMWNDLHTLRLTPEIWIGTELSHLS